MGVALMAAEQGPREAGMRPASSAGRRHAYVYAAKVAQRGGGREGFHAY